MSLDDFEENKSNGGTLAGNAPNRVLKTKNPTIKDVATIAGVSPATVGRVIGDYGYVHPETRAKVIAVVKELGFNPNEVARSLKSNSTKTLEHTAQLARKIIEQQKINAKIETTLDRK